jgi:hypothetical protein
VAALTLAPLASLAIAGNSFATLQLAIDPEADGDLSTTIAAADTSGNNSVHVPITGKVATASVSVPSAVALGTYCVNQPTTPTALVLQSTGTATITVGAPAMATPGSPFQLALRVPTLYPAALAPGTPDAIDVSPGRQGSAVDVSDDVVWTTDIDGVQHPHTTVSAKFLAAGVALAPASLGFGEESIHLYVKNAQPLTIQNCSGPTLTLTPTIDAPFSIDSDFPTTLGAVPQTFAIGFHPTKTGTVTKFLRITTSDQQVLEVQLTGTGIANGTGEDGGLGSAGYHATSFYACSCTTSSPGGALAIALAIIAVIAPRRALSGRRRRGSSSPR